MYRFCEYLFIINALFLLDLFALFLDFLTFYKIEKQKHCFNVSLFCYVDVR